MIEEIVRLTSRDRSQTFYFIHFPMQGRIKSSLAHDLQTHVSLCCRLGSPVKKGKDYGFQKQIGAFENPGKPRKISTCGDRAIRLVD